MNTAYIGLGSNLGDSLNVVRQGWLALGTLPGITLGRLSHPYRTEPVDMVSDHWFINAAGELATSLSPRELLQSLHRIEERFGRRRDSDAAGYQDRTLDFDLLLYGRICIRDEDLEVPHPALSKRLFVLLPLSEIAGDIRHPVRNRTIADLLAELPATGENPGVEMLQWPADTL